MEFTLYIILLFLSAFFSGSETAFLSIGKIRFEQLQNMKTPSAKRVVKLLSDPHKLLITILIGNTLVNIAASAVMTDLCYSAFGEKGVAISIFLMTFIVLVFGEVTPKMLAITRAVSFSFFSSLPLSLLEKVLAPFRIVLHKVANTIVRGAGINVISDRPKITEQEIRSLFHLGKKKGIVKEKEKDMIESILEFKELNAADVMTPRIDMVALDLTMDRSELISRIKDEKCSRLPVYMHTLDNIVGMIYAKDFLINPELPVKDLIKRPYFVPESKRIDELLNEMQKRHIHMAIVTDEYGVTSGLVTIEDILEEIVGEIRDEHDFEEPNIKMIDQKTLEVKGQTHIDEVNEHIAGINIETDEVDTIGGFVTLVMGEIPHAGDSVEVNGYSLTVKDVSKNRITSLVIEKKTA
ncbi:MAG: DUF21 domain-containing protein [Candidatus Omnitrophica bacterium]|nr:DUF21 domain-containing protein [Candidatus Omnitrophota bacterium]